MTGLSRSMAIVSAVIAGAGLAIIFTMTATSAQNIGCCMQREHQGENAAWIQIGDTFNECQRLNAELDGEDDDVFADTGFIQWLIDC